ncbi:DUF6597 domain-containing transcriptional factor [Planomonospora algeriensis]
MYREWAPDPALADRLVCVWTRVATSAGTGLVVPDGCVDLIWGPRGPHVAGPDTGPMPVAMSPGDRYTGVRFRPGAVGDAFGVPVEALRDLRVPLTDLGGLPRLDAEAVSAAIATAGTAGDGASGTSSGPSRRRWPYGCARRPGRTRPRRWSPRRCGPGGASGRSPATSG